jgi:predicted dehydrogenase
MGSKLKLGILGCAGIIENAIVNPLKNIKSIELYAIASRNSGNARLFSEKYSIKVAHESYDDLLYDSNVDFVYIALPNDLHVPWAMKAAEAGKHIIVEKPLSTNVKEITPLIMLCKDKNIHLLEGLMVQHHPWQKEIKNIIDNKIYGVLRKIQLNISFIPKYNLSSNYRGDPVKGGGSFYDLAPYWIQFIQSIRDLDTVQYDGSSFFNGPNNCDLTFNAILKFPDGLISTCETSFEKTYSARLSLVFDKAVLTIKDIFRSILGRFKMAYTVTDLTGQITDKNYFPPSNYYENQLIFFEDVIRYKKENIPIEQSLQRISLMENIYRTAYGKFKKEN